MDSFDHDMAGGIGGETSASKRSRSRDSLFLIARLTIDGESEGHDVRIRNLSEGGLMAEFDRKIPVSTKVALEVRGLGEIHGHIAWYTDGRMGIALDQRIDPKRARHRVGGGTQTPFYAKSVVGPKTGTSR